MRPRLSLALLMLAACGPDKSDETGSATTGTSVADSTTTTGETAETSSSTDVAPTTEPSGCEFDEDCDPCGVCVDGACVGPPTCDDSCLDDGDCMEGLVCVDGTCVEMPEPEELPACSPNTLTKTEESLGAGISAVSLIDTNADDIVDLLYAVPAPGVLEIGLNFDMGVFEIVATIQVGGPATHLSFAPGDLDGDGVFELVVARAGADRGVVLLTGQGVDYVAGPVLPAAADPTAVYVADIDGDGANDVITLHADAPFIAVRRGDGVGGLAPEVAAGIDEPPGEQASIVAISGPTTQDLLVSFRGASALRVLVGEPDATLSDVLGVPTVGPATAALAAELDDDGLPELIAVEDDRVEVFRSQRPLQWSIPTSHIPGHALRGGHVLEFDGLPGRDLVAASSQPFLVILHGDGDGGFSCQESLALPAPTTAQMLARGDIDSDGDIDLILGGADGELTTVRSE